MGKEHEAVAFWLMKHSPFDGDIVIEAREQGFVNFRHGGDVISPALGPRGW